MNLIVVLVLVGCGFVGTIASAANGHKLSDNRLYDGIMALLILGGVGVFAVASFLNVSWLLPLGVSLILASCPWGLLGHRLFK